MVRDEGIDSAECRAALEQLLDSEVLSGSRRLSEFCAYSGQAAMDGRSELEQYEIARDVLGRDSDFNPYEDAAVRKLATQLRHKLEEYYSGLGSTSPVVISLPRRSYVLRFRRRGDADAGAPRESPAQDSADLDEALPETPARDHQQTATRPPDAPLRPRHWKWLLAGFLLGVLPLLGWKWLARLRTLDSLAVAGNAPRFVSTIIETREGDFSGRDIDVVPGAVQLGPPLGECEDAMVRLKFTAEYTNQQAGLMAMYDPDNYVRIGQHFKNRPMLEFGFEWNGSYEGPLSTYLYDPAGQLLQSRWFALRRNGTRYTSYISSDGLGWTPFGKPVAPPDRRDDPRAAIYALNGRSVSPSASAKFDHFGVGIAFHDRPDGPFELNPSSAWRQAWICRSEASASIREGVLQVGFARDAIGCSWSLRHDVPDGDWAISALIDFEPVAGSSFGIEIDGVKSPVALTRRDLDGRSIQLEQRDDRDARIDDFLGSPPVLLRLEKRSGVVRGSISRDLETFIELPGTVSTSELGELRSVGLTGSIAHWTDPENRPPARVYWVRLETLHPDFLSR